MSILHSSFAVLVTACALTACSNPDPAAPITPAVPMPQIDAAIANSTPEAAARGMSNKTWLWTRGTGPAEIHYSTADGRDFAWVVGQRRIIAGEWKTETGVDSRGQTITQICLRYPGVRPQGLMSSDWNCRPGGTFFYEMAEREAGDPLRIMGRTDAPFVLNRTPANLAEVEARVRG